jgi:CRISPR-associated protein Cmr4
MMTNGKDHDDVRRIFGSEASTTEGAGQVLFSDARLAFLPLRSLDCAFVYATCPHLLGRLRRDLIFARTPGEGSGAAGVGAIKQGEALFDGNASQIFVEEFAFGRDALEWSEQKPTIAALLSPAQGVDADVVMNCLVVLSDADFGWFARRRLHVRMRNRLDPENKTVEPHALWSEESLPPETLMYVVLTARATAFDQAPNEIADDALKASGDYIQIGANETVGEGWFKVLRAADTKGAGNAQ